MSERAFFLPDARHRVADTIAAIEAETAAEIVVAVRRQSGRYRDVDLAVGSVVAFGALLLVLFHPRPFPIAEIPFEIALAFAFGVVVSANVATLRRRFVTRARRDEAARTAARAAFYDMRIARTRGRTGVLVFVSIFERSVAVVADSGVPIDAMGPQWLAAVAAIEAAGRAADLGRFLAALRSLTPPLAAALPIQDDDVDELPNEPEVA